MDWGRFLNRAWKSFYTKKKNREERTFSFLHFFANDYSRRLGIIEYHLKRNDYKFGKWKALFVPKKGGGNRLLVIPSMIRDKIVLKAISDYLSEVLSQEFNHVRSISYAYQKGRNTREALIQLKKIHQPGNVLLKIDIRHFFDEIDKNILMQLIDRYAIDKYVKILIHNAMNPSIDFSKIKDSELEIFPKGGIPQGNPISAVLSNLYLLELDNWALSEGWKMVRYADDMVFSVSSLKEALVILKQVEKYLSYNRKLTIHPLGNSADAKTFISQDPKKNNIKYLGVIFDGKNLYPTQECCEILALKIKSILRGLSIPKEKEIDIKKAISQWCGYYAFTDITMSQMNYIDNKINYWIRKSKLNICEFYVADMIRKVRKRQNRKITKIFRPMQFDDDFKWLNIYG